MNAGLKDKLFLLAEGTCIIFFSLDLIKVSNKIGT